MQSSQFLNEGNDKTVNDVKQNHPEIYDFFKQVGAWMSFDQHGQVESYNTAGNHMVVIKLKPSAGLSNTKANLEAAGIQYDSIKDTWAGELVIGTFGNDIHFTVKDDNKRGNITETWQFAFPHADDEVATYHDRTMEEVDEGDAVPGDFSAKDGPKPQTQNMKPISLAQAFGSEAYNVLADAGIKFHKKPSYWSDLERNALGEIGQKRVQKILADAGIELEEFPAWQLYPIDDMNPDDYVKGPLQTVENMPKQKVFIIYDLPYSDLRHGVQDPRVGTFLVDRQGASSYIRFWRQIS